jgi:hypothetical protein
MGMWRTYSNPDPEAKWKEMLTALYQSGLDALWKKENKHKNRLEENLEENGTYRGDKACYVPSSRKQSLPAFKLCTQGRLQPMPT